MQPWIVVGLSSGVFPGAEPDRDQSPQSPCLLAAMAPACCRQHGSLDHLLCQEPWHHPWCRPLQGSTITGTARHARLGDLEVGPLALHLLFHLPPAHWFLILQEPDQDTFQRLLSSQLQLCLLLPPPTLTPDQSLVPPLKHPDLASSTVATPTACASALTSIPCGCRVSSRAGSLHHGIQRPLHCHQHNPRCSPSFPWPRPKLDRHHIPSFTPE